MTIRKEIKHSLDKLEAYLDSTELKGYDPYDALNSKIISKVSLNNKFLRIAYTQGLKRLPINLRAFLGIRKGYNPKGLGLFLSAYLKMYSISKGEKYLEKVRQIVFILNETRSTTYSGYCWGYNFDWQSRTGFTPKWTPTIVNTAFIAHAFLDAYEVLGEEVFLEMARSSCDFILKDLNITMTNNSLCFSYTPIDRSKVHNANILGAGLLARVYSITLEDQLLQYARKAVTYVANRQRTDGSWYYGENTVQHWIDNYHTGFVLDNLLNYITFTGDRTYYNNLKKGFEFFHTYFFLHDGTPKYFHDRVYPIDIHSSAQAILTLVKLKDISDGSGLLEKVARWMVAHMQDDRGYFYYRKGRFFYNKIPYIRWSQSWAFHALTTYYVSLQNNLA